ncbi:hypothetical protein GOV05_00450 [Candidatus Woesearchaeota archaeon]|nr:hypothetical protein [Candidatus Woesearchaeota archaeon]
MALLNFLNPTYQISLLLAGITIFFLGFISGIKTFKYLKKYFDLSFKFQKEEDKNKLEEEGYKMSETLTQLIPWSLTYMMSVVLFIIILYSLTN